MKKKYKTKFPVARIKKIMQLDEDVGKVAQATPVLICKFISSARPPPPFKVSEVFFLLIVKSAKALELFMQSLIDQACQETRQRNAKRLSAAHL
ncbi:hypothetical protein BDB00DRAFT_845196 [Zychaea mexicana]|uniref:uncharacterized protein n=1 Tax=Zychaea mexicana TaxID=64656 RepID=UPI0022FDFE26|nr:uncharacterized protein BDB00DRAFT_845196 [Zychaea mexicana]KAI9489104.1 hypothetical protein BDB00DRAFT_845196 [Zychaea mexicana]